LSTLEIQKEQFRQELVALVSWLDQVTEEKVEVLI